MAIVFTRLRFMRLLLNSGACEILAYTSRGPMFVQRFGRTVGDGKLPDDLVHEEIIIAPDGDLSAFPTTEELANAIDAAEIAHVRRPLTARDRYPQIGIAIVSALPPDPQMTLDEVIEIPHRMVDRVRGDRRLVIHAAFHEPALITQGAVTRHVHLFIPSREYQDGRFAKRKIHGIFARPRDSAQPNVRGTYIAEGVDWPRLSWQIQQTLFTECASDLLVDPIAPFSEPNWTPSIYRTDPERVSQHRSIAKSLNLGAIHGEPAALVEKLLRGRSTLLVWELHRFIEKLVDGENDRRQQFERILGDPSVTTLSDEPGEKRPRFVTTSAVHGLLLRAAELVDRAADKSGAWAIHAVTAPHHDGVVAAIGDLLRTKNLCRSARAPGPLVLGVDQSDAEQLVDAASFARPVLATIRHALEEPVLKRRSGARKQTTLRHRGIVVVPRGEAVDDQTLARLLLAGAKKRCTVIIGYDQSRRTGIVCNRLAVHAVERLARLPALTADAIYDREAVERWLRAGLVGPAIQSMAPILRFAPVDDASADEGLANFIVCDDPGRIASTNQRLQALRAHKDSVKLDLPRGSLLLYRDQWILFTQTDYSVRPPRIRAGALAKIVEIDAERHTISVLLSGGETELIELSKAPHIRSAYALAIREARQIKQPCTLRIEISNARHAWAALLLAARQPQTPAVIVDPRVACDVATLITAVRTSLPAALPHNLIRRPDPDAELVKILNGQLPDPAALKDFEIENMPEPDPSKPVEPPPRALPDADAELSGVLNTMAPEPIDARNLELEIFPEPDPPKVVQSAPRIAAHERVRAMIAGNLDARRGYQQLVQWLRPDNPDRDAAKQRILDLCGPDSLTAAIVKIITEPEPSRPETKDELDAEFDLPHDLNRFAPREWTNWELYQCRADLWTMTCPSQWGISAPPDPGVNLSRRR